jgi:hypothetical protein
MKKIYKMIKEHYEKARIKIEGARKAAMKEKILLFIKHLHKTLKKEYDLNKKIFKFVSTELTKTNISFLSLYHTAHKYMGSIYLSLACFLFVAGVILMLYAGISYSVSIPYYKEGARIRYNLVVSGVVYQTLLIVIPLSFIGLAELFLPPALKSNKLGLPKSISFLSLFLLVAAHVLLIVSLMHAPYQPQYKLFEYFFGRLIFSGNPAFDLNVLSLYLSTVAYALSCINILSSIFITRSVVLKDIPWWVWLFGIVASFVLFLYCPGLIFLAQSYNTRLF